MIGRTDSSTNSAPRRLSSESKAQAIGELKRRGKEEWGPSYYSQVAPEQLCLLAGRPRAVQYGALISWLKRLGQEGRADPSGAVELVAHLLASPPETVTEALDPSDLARAKARPRARRGASEAEVFAINCPSVIHDHRFVVLGELPGSDLYPVVLLQPLDGDGYWYPQVARHNPLRTGRCFACFVRLGNPGGIWHTKKPPLDAKVRVVALKKKWDLEKTHRLSEDELAQVLDSLCVVAQDDTLVSRVSIEPLQPTLQDAGRFLAEPLKLQPLPAETCVAPLKLDWQGGAAYIEIREGLGDRLLFHGTAAPGAVLTLRGRSHSMPTDDVIFELMEPGRYRVRLYPAASSFVEPLHEWWLEIT